MVQAQQISRKKGTGSIKAMEDEKKGDLWDTKDQRANTETTFFESDIEELEVSRRRKERLKRMLRRQEGETPGESFAEGTQSRGQQNHGEWQRRLVCTFTARLDLTDHQKSRVKHLVLDVLDINSFAQYSTEDVIMAVTSMVANEDGRWIRDESEFKSLLDELDITLDDVTTVRQMARDRL